ncbi:diguanylate cyclase [Persephonella sp.]
MDRKDFKKIIVKAYEDFFSELLENSYLQEFFSSDDIDRIRESQISSFLAALEEDDEKLRERYIQLGKFHYRINLPYVEFFGSLETLKKHIFVSLMREEKLDARTLNNCFKLFEKIKNYSALGYLFSIVEEDKSTIQGEIDKKLEEDFIKEHLIWFHDLLFDIENLSETPSVEVDENKCKVSTWLNSDEIKDLFINEDELNKIKFIHRSIHESAKEAYNTISRKEYLKLLETYVYLVKNVLAMISILTVEFAKRNVEKSRKDPLTNVLNRSIMEMVLNRTFEISKVSETPISIAMLDLDDFKKINDRFGHLVGDCVLKKIAEIIIKSLRKSDFVFRYGGEEFLILLPSTDEENAYRIMEKVRKNIENAEIVCENEKVKITASIGVITVYPDERIDIKNLINKADKNLYIAKKSGKNRVFLEGDDIKDVTQQVGHK